MIEIFTFWIPLGSLVLWACIVFRLMYIMVKTGSIHNKTYFQQTIDYIRSVLNV